MRHDQRTQFDVLLSEQPLKPLLAGSLVFVSNADYFDEIAEQSTTDFHPVRVDQK